MVSTGSTVLKKSQDAQVPGAVSIRENYSFIWGILGFFCALFLMKGRGVPPCLAATGALTATALPMAVVHWLGLRAHRHPSTGLDFDVSRRTWNFQRTLVKYLGFVGTLGIVGLGYWLLPEYHSDYYKSFLQAAVFLPWIVIGAFPYFLWVDSRQAKPEDEYWHMGCLLLGRWHGVDWRMLYTHGMGWLVKAFFLPLMFVYLGNNVRGLLLNNFRPQSYMGFHGLVWDLFGTLDVLFACMGYLLTVRVLDSQIRSTEPTLLGWMVALVCYEPFWGWVGPRYFDYYGAMSWDKWLEGLPWLRGIWGVVILGLMAIYTWATLTFGFRFSNLTHRGIITHGPYRLVKHPAYLSKNIMWWLMDLPFLSTAGWPGGIRQCILLLLLNGIYWLRAKTEERHLSRDPVYVAYCRWVDENGFWSRIKKRFQLLFPIGRAGGEKGPVSPMGSKTGMFFILRSGISARRLLVALVVAGTLARVIACFYFNPLDHLYSDALRHWTNGHQFFQPNLMAGCDSIGYQAYVLLLRFITQDNRYAVALACGLLSAFMPWTYYRAGREFGLSRNRALFLYGLVAWMPSLLFVYHFIMTETLLLALGGLSLWMFARHLRKGDLRSFLVAVAVWTLACMTKMILLPLAIVCLAYGWWQHSRKVSHLLTAAAVAVVLLIPAAVRSYRVLGFVAPLGNSWLQKIHHHAGTMDIEIRCRGYHWRYGSPSAHIRPLEPFSDWAMRRSREDTVICVQVDPSNGERDWKQAYERLPDTWRNWLDRQNENTVLFFFAPAWPEANRPSWEGWINRGQRWLWAPLILFVTTCNLRMFLARRFDLIPVATTLLALALLFQDVATMEGRFRKPLEPMLLLNLVWVVRPLRRGKIFPLGAEETRVVEERVCKKRG